MENENNILNKLPPFYINQKVIRIKDNTIHVVKRCVLYSCGEWVVDIGNLRENEVTHCCTKECCIGEISSVILYRSDSLVPVQQQKFPLIQLKEVIKKEKELTLAN